MKPLLILATPLLLATTAIAQSSSQPKTDNSRSGSPAACPVHLDEAYTTSGTGAIPAQAEPDKSAHPRTIHVGVENASGKTILSFVTTVSLFHEPDALPGEPAKTQRINHTWNGNLLPGEHEKEEWKFTPNANNAGVARVIFNKVKFADGTTWNRAPGDACSFRVSGRMVPAHIPATR